MRTAPPASDSKAVTARMRSGCTGVSGWVVADGRWLGRCRRRLGGERLAAQSEKHQGKAPTLLNTGQPTLAVCCPEQPLHLGRAAV